jgi:hypothetical protein
MTGKQGTYLAVSISLLLVAGCAGSPGVETGTAGTTGASGTTGGSGSGGGAGTGSASGTGGGMPDGGTAGTGSAGSGSAGTGTDGGMTDGAKDGPFTCPTLPAGTCTPPADMRCPYPKLSQTGCIDPMPFSDPKIPLKMASSVIPYEVNSPLWSDGALKTRGMKLPATGKIHVKDCVANPAECCVLDPITLTGCLPPADDGKWDFPVGTVMVKNFMFPDTSRPSGMKVVETRLLVHMDKPVEVEGKNTDWVGYSYQWDDAQTEATIVGTLVGGSDTGVSAMFQTKPTQGGATQQVKWDYPSRIDCVTCHVKVKPSGGYVLGPETVQMNRIATGETMNQIDKLAAMGAFEKPPAKPYKAALVPPYPGQSGSPKATDTVEQRARSYLHANCSFCHRPDGVWNGFDVRYDVSFKNATICNATPGKGEQGVPGALILTPKMPNSSVMLLRMKAPPGNEMTGGTGRMPAIASQVVDTQATDLSSQWISSINACP